MRAQDTRSSPGRHAYCLHSQRKINRIDNPIVARIKLKRKHRRLARSENGADRRCRDDDMRVVPVPLAAVCLRHIRLISTALDADAVRNLLSSPAG